MNTITGDPHTVAGLKAGQYIRRIRNGQKKQYARAYLHYVLRGRQGTEPDRGTLSYMAAQAVRMELDSNLCGSRARNQRGGNVRLIQDRAGENWHSDDPAGLYIRRTASLGVVGFEAW